MRKKLMTIILAVSVALSMSLCAFAGSWQQDATGYWWQRDDGSYPAGGWEWIDDNGNGMAECYYFDPSGYCIINDVTPDGYIVDADGAWVVDGVIQMQATAAADTGSAASEVMPYKSIVDQYNNNDAYNLRLWRNGSPSIIDGGDYYEISDCQLYIDVIYDAALVESKKVGDTITVAGVPCKITSIETINNTKQYILDNGNMNSQYYCLFKDGNVYKADDSMDYIESTCVYDGAMRFRKDAVITTVSAYNPNSHSITTPEIYFYQPRDLSVRNSGYYIDSYDGPSLFLSGKIQVDDQGYVISLNEIFSP